jgi:hypothetical protein
VRLNQCILSFETTLAGFDFFRLLSSSMAVKVCSAKKKRILLQNHPKGDFLFPVYAAFSLHPERFTFESIQLILWQ